MGKVQDWMYCQNSIRVTNIQTLNVCFKKGINYAKKNYFYFFSFLSAQKPNLTLRIDYLRSKYSLDTCLRIIRVYYVTRQEGLIERPFNLTYKTFVPPILEKKNHGHSNYEPMNILFKREISPFIKFNSPTKVINYETIPYYYKTKTEETTSMGNYRYVYLICIRVYFDGPIEEPPKGYIEPHDGPSTVFDNCSIL